jgi:hypothetical protein
MNDESDEIKRWTARRKAAAVMDIIKGKTSSSELARTHGLTLAEVEQSLGSSLGSGLAFQQNGLTMVLHSPFDEPCQGPCVINIPVRFTT